MVGKRKEEVRTEKVEEIEKKDRIRAKGTMNER